MPNDPAVEQDVWQNVATPLEKRWAAENDIDVRHALGQSLTQVLSGRVGAEQCLAFLRRQLREGPDKLRTQYVRTLFDALLSQPYSAEYETEAFDLLEQLSDDEEPAVRLLAAVQALYRLTDRMVQARYDALMAKVEHQEKLTRIELQTRKTDNLRAVREGFADRLAEDMGKRSRHWPRG